jgi:hypothetical protein
MGENWRNYEKKSFRATLESQPGFSPRLRSDKPASTRLSYGTAYLSLNKTEGSEIKNYAH